MPRARATADNEKASHLAGRLRTLRNHAGLTLRNTSTAAHVSPQTWERWESGSNAPRPWRLDAIASALGVPIAALFRDNVVSEVTLSDEAVARVRELGEPEAIRLAALVAAQLPPLILQAARPLVAAAPGQRAKPRRTRAQVLAGIAEANRMREAAAQRRAGQGPPEGPSVQASGGLPHGSAVDRGVSDLSTLRAEGDE